MKKAKKIKDFSARMKTARLRNGQSLQNVADKAGMTKSHIWELEQGSAKNPTIKAVLNICGALDMPVSDFLGLAMDDSLRSALYDEANKLEATAKRLRTLASTT